MKSQKFLRILILLVAMLGLVACQQEAQVEPSPTPIPPTHAPPTAIPTTEPTYTPVFTPTSTSTLEPTPIPGVMVYPVSSLGDEIPWLPLDEARRPTSVFFTFNLNKPPFNDVLIRKAFAAAVDREKIVEIAEGFSYREAQPATTITPPMVLGRDLYGEVGIPFDPAQAKAYIEEAGYTDMGSFPTVTLLVYSRGEAAPSSYYRMAVDVIIPMWEEYLGITVELNMIGEVGGGKLVNEVKNTQPDIFILGWGADYVDPDNFLRELFNTSAQWNLLDYSNKQFDSLVTQANRSDDPMERLLLYIEAEKFLTEEEAAVIPLFHSLFYIGN